jgi:hypothetical protein
MKAIVVYDSLWGNTAAIARGIAEGIGSEACAVSTAEASGAALLNAEVLVAGAPVHTFKLPTEAVRERIRANGNSYPAPPEVSHPSMRSWLALLPEGGLPAAVFETAVWWSPGGATAEIMHALMKAGYRPVVKPRRFVVTGRYGPLRDGEIDRARYWGALVALSVR